MEKENFKEYLKCTLDAKYAIEKYFVVKDNTSRNNLPFNLQYSQKEILDNINMYRFNIIKKSRQIGSTLLLVVK